MGAGKTTLIKKLLAEAYQGEKLVLIENEFGEIGIDGGFLKDAGIQITEMNSGCICCSLVGDFSKALKEVHGAVPPRPHPHRALRRGQALRRDRGGGERRARTCRHEAEQLRHRGRRQARCKVYMKNFGEFYNNQIESAGTIILSRTQKLSQEKLEAAAAMLREKNADAAIITTPWDQIDGKTILAAVEKVSLADEMLEKMRAEHEADEHEHEHEHHHHHDHDGHEEHDHEHCHHDHDDDDHDHDHCHHDHDEHEHHHHHDGEECDDPHCGCHHHHHHADEVFTSWGEETVKPFTEEQLHHILTALDGGEYGQIVRAKGIVPNGEGKWLHFDYVPEEHEVRFGPADYTGRLCVIGANLDEHKLHELFGL